MNNYPNNTTWSKDDMYITCEPIYCSDHDMTFYMETMWSLMETGEPEVVGERVVGFEHGEWPSFVPKHDKTDSEWINRGYAWPKAIEFKEVTYRYVITHPLNATIEVKASTKQLAFEKFKDLCPGWKSYVYRVEVPF